ncbi:MAG: tRNA (adenosine(37)-N6)-threonylcarbamoyltransferase complex ATPase subunit type 1 TsaE [Psychroserpens sp.]|nr:tRNA (adenosine(37)-N6)-threonylcarbamoyltransferase complex ATPase subunit type 1 TsaE [Psychroserpens sp.]MBO6632746.1 tRNA (adenosine(37)-N6)-threonylcarbamoyltransferase complex ATPase subunit type 1 TsaE [Psychroserpens sp.]MBO6653172.1 tRNA (adenosine(37)-N6)-threonylcarbamoyltransferase complex ATPase subunit type 1 TsaE [Psychroserpens sp.]MBO6680800.1 tRNA (adenosine(37)-N6)-threonylcarbamoyltransferase complex ATPase subunit type 1 TsaE [Psychroserpens sp.]MBO6750242.1 tRNA (adenos
MKTTLEKTYQIDDIDAIAKDLVSGFSSRTILFYGDMGVGKTTLIKALVSSLGSQDEVNSPTFSIVNEYISEDRSIYHFDLYRIEDEEEALNFGFEDYLYTSNWVFIEWPDNAKSLLPEDYNRIDITMIDKTSRSLKLSQNETLTYKNAMEQYKI